MIGLPYLAGGAAVAIALAGVGGYVKGRGDGREVEAGKWQKVGSAAVAAAQAKSDELQAQVDAGAVALSQMTAENDRLATLAAQSRKAFYVQNPAAAGPCLHPDRLRAIQAGDEAANAAITAR
jgi:hypothetical protein